MSNSDGLKYFRCNICSKFFKLKLKEKHIKMHKIPRPFECKYCDKKFRTAYDVRRHEQVHTGEKPHKCSICFKTFAARGNMYIHIRNCHPNDLPFECRICSEMFSHSYLLTDHMDVAHPGEDHALRTFECNICFRDFRWEHNLKSHMKTHNRDNISDESSTDTDMDHLPEEKPVDYPLSLPECASKGPLLKFLNHLSSNSSSSWPKVVLSNSLNELMLNSVNTLL